MTSTGQQAKASPEAPIPDRPSEQSVRLAEFMTRRMRPFADRWLPRGPGLLAVRAFANSAGYRRLPDGARTWQARYGSISGSWVQAPGASAATGVVLHLHGGGFVFGSPRSHRGLAYQLSRSTGMPVFLPHYRRAPKHPFPAAADDCHAAYQALRDGGFPAERIRIVGDSAGGHLTAGLVADLARSDAELPGAVALFSPLLDLSCERLTERDATYRDPFIPPDGTRRACEAYLGATPVSTPRLDVLGADKSGWPPVLVQVGGTECLQVDAERMLESLRAAEVACELQVWPGQIHVFQAWAYLPEARAATRYAGRFLATPPRQN